MKYKIRKGLEAPCKIKGLLSTDYWLMVTWLAAMAIMFFLGIRTALTTGNSRHSIQIILLTIIVTPMLYKKFKERARPKKYDEVKRDITISNLDLFKTIRR